MLLLQIFWDYFSRGLLNQLLFYRKFFGDLCVSVTLSGAKNDKKDGTPGTAFPTTTATTKKPIAYSILFSAPSMSICRILRPIMTFTTRANSSVMAQESTKESGVVATMRGRVPSTATNT